MQHLPASYFIEIIKTELIKRNLKDLIQEFDITSSRTKWQICQILCVPIVLCIAELCNMPRAMWAGIAAMSVIFAALMEDKCTTEPCEYCRCYMFYSAIFSLGFLRQSMHI